ncbi:MAG: VWA domain-containing protein [Sodaliphilus sp.]|nr:VWA domain-containing protein [Bacteroidales bacterium]MDY3077580.1 VWA domain-containing protein [Sodaliphilus sp.]UKI45169.1 MAG: VWA domain-containing protein [Porphyromonadaceae bacterium]MCI6625353.1 VWA domain-containing protein [Bacteroidales bacterium]MCI6657399.1 VWA domain-containing protein [Bacteroidales bacterium]
MNLAHPGYLWLFLLFIPLIAWYVWSQRKANPSMRMSSISAFKGLSTSWKVYVKHFSFVLKLAALSCLIIILCRPQTYDKWSMSDTEGTDIVMAIDISASMLSRDLQPDRLEAAKKVASDFVAKRESDNIGLVIFAGEGFTLLPMTTHQATLLNTIHEISINMLDADGTAIGDGIATAINRIKDGKAKSKSIILLTDGTNNSGVVAPLTAAEIAQKEGIRIYTIGLGTRGTAETPYAQGFGGELLYKPMPVTIDEESLKKVAQMTGGKYFRATDNDVLTSIFNEIDKLEKTKIDVKNFTNTQDNYMPWAWALLLLVLLNLTISYTVLRRIP